jgi:hypothetical protein
MDRIGGKDVLTLVISFASFADMAPDEPSFFEFLADKMGSPEAANEMFTKFGAGFESSDYGVWVYDAEISTPKKKE